MQEETMIAEKTLTAEEMLDAELRSEDKHDFINGKLTEMAGESYNHNKIKFEIGLLMEMSFRAKGMSFEVLDSDQKTWMDAIGKYHYPGGWCLKSVDSGFFMKTEVNAF